jgi:transposase
MRIKGTPAELEARRRRAAELLAQGTGTNEVARLIGCSTGSIHRWKKAIKKRGTDGLKAKPHLGPKSRLNGNDKRRLVALLKRGAVAAGYDNDLWTCRRVADLINNTFGVRYDPDHVWRILHSLGFSSQKPEHRARERDEKAIEDWRKKEWPRIKKTHGG